MHYRYSSVSPPHAACTAAQHWSKATSVLLPKLHAAGEVASLDPSQNREQRYYLNDMLTMYERMAKYADKVSRDERIKVGTLDACGYTCGCVSAYAHVFASKVALAKAVRSTHLYGSDPCRCGLIPPPRCCRTSLSPQQAQSTALHSGSALLPTAVSRWACHG